MPVERPRADSVLDAFAGELEIRRLTPAQFVQVLETLHMLGSVGAGIELGSLSTQLLVDVVNDASKEQINELAAHEELRSVFLDEIFRRMSDHLIEEKVKNVEFVIGWRFHHGDADGPFDRYQTVVEDGVCVSSSDLGRTPDATVTVSAADFIRMATGVTAAAAMFVTGKVRVKGDYALAVRFSSYFDIPKASLQ
ncbi:SCP2 sterol-binding domain-containing protein [Amycolatopsis sp. 195334CR]|uniref:SCP2 sterol-binding domain-containing protein n=1 Tax=Amycolatopsis sp. 195334CR TaxID=2814588 RepID=UPI001A8FE2C9|nr:SCP2 sterol-binding domain-containing protein [Amycolatopsis sp. 195334CR]MBN6035737.1 SCP2 sterol-binding domain-containing protein [Amycolatopsis sp. 195334CR]